MLYQSTSQARRLLEPDSPERFHSRYLLLDGERVRLVLPAGSTVDFLAFRAALAAMPPMRDEAIAVYGGDLFHEALYEEWAAPAREELAQAYQGARFARARLRLEQGAVDDALADARTLLRRDACHEDATLIAMLAARSKGDRPTALRVYRALEGALDADFGIAPRDDVAQLASQIQRSTPTS